MRIGTTIVRMQELGKTCPEETRQRLPSGCVFAAKETDRPGRFAAAWPRAAGTRCVAVRVALPSLRVFAGLPGTPSNIGPAWSGVAEAVPPALPALAPEPAFDRTATAAETRKSPWKALLPGSGRTQTANRTPASAVTRPEEFPAGPFRAGNRPSLRGAFER